MKFLILLILLTGCANHTHPSIDNRVEVILRLADKNNPDWVEYTREHGAVKADRIRMLIVSLSSFMALTAESNKDFLLKMVE